MSAIVKTPGPQIGLATARWDEQWSVMRDQANALVKSGFLPSTIKTPEQAIAVIMTGRELGLEPMLSLREINIIKGKPTLSANLMAGLVLQRIPGGVMDVKEASDTRCVILAGRSRDAAIEFVWTIEDARRAQLTGNDNWKKFPKAMLLARCKSEAARAIAPDVLAGFYTPEEMSAVVESEPYTERARHDEPSEPESHIPPPDHIASEIIELFATATTEEQIKQAIELATAHKAEINGYRPMVIGAMNAAKKHLAEMVTGEFDDASETAAE